MMQRTLALRSSGVIDIQVVKTAKKVMTGKNTAKTIVDYLIDEKTKDFLLERCTSKLCKIKPMHNETIILGLLKKYFSAKGIKFDFQKEIEEFVADGLIGDKVVLEYDEPYHNCTAIMYKDARKDKVYKELGYKIFRCSLDDDIVDIILGIERLLNTS